MLGSSDQSALLAAHFGFPFSFAHFISGEGGPQIVSAYRDHYNPSVRWPEPIVNVGVFAVAADTEEEAENIMKSRDLWSVRQRQGLTAPVPSLEESEQYQFGPHEEALRQYNRQRCIWGTPETVRDGLLSLGEIYNVDEFVILTICSKFESRCRSYELLAEAFELAPRE